MFLSHKLFDEQFRIKIISEENTESPRNISFKFDYTNGKFRILTT
jgi:hypothetical protein